MKQKRLHLKKRKDGRFCCRYGNIFFYANTEDDCLRQRDEYKRRLAENTVIGNNYTVEQYAARFMAVYKQSVTDGTYNEIVRCYKRMCEFHSIGQRRMKDVTNIDIQEFINQYAQFTPKTLERMLSRIKELFQTATDDQIIQRNPVLRITIPHTTEDGSHRAITPAERKLILTTEHPMKPLVMVMLYAGLRRGEALALNIDTDVDFKAKTITVSKAIRFDPHGHATLEKPKTAAGVRVVPLFSPLERELIGRHGTLYPAQDVRILANFQSKWNSYIHALETALNGRSKRWYGKMKADQGRQLPPWQSVSIQCHDLRHSFATMICTAVDLKTAMTWMGHSNERMLLHIYDHVDELRTQIAVKNVENLLLSVQSGSQTKKAPTE